MKVIFKDNQFSFQILRLLGGATSGASDIGEVISTAKKIKEGDFQSWCKEWTALAKRIETFADECYSKGHLISARQAYLRASNYYRTAEFYLHENPNDPRINELYNAGINCFSYVMKLNKPAIEAVKIPYEDTTLPGHFYHIDNNPRPVLVLVNGYDGTKEEFYGLAISHGMYVSHAKTPAEYLLKTENYYLKGIAEKIKCPTLVIDTENENFFPGQAKALYDELECRKDFMLFTKEEGAEEHCQVGAKLIASQRIFNWIEDTIKNKIKK